MVSPGSLLSIYFKLYSVSMEITETILKFYISPFFSVIASNFLPSRFLINTIAYYWVFFYVGGILNQFRFLEKFEGKYKIILSLYLLFLVIIEIQLPHKYTIPISLLILPCSYLIILNRTIDSIEFLGSLSFGIYLFHSPLIYITYTRFTDSNPWIILFLNFVVLGIVASLITFLKKVSSKIYCWRIIH